MAVTKRLYRSSTDRIIAGVCGGMGEYTGIDPTLIRLIWIAFIVLSGLLPGIFVYIIAVLIIPEEPTKRPSPRSGTSSPSPTPKTGA